MPNDKEFELDDLESFSFDDLSLDDAPSSDAPPEAASGEDPFGVWVKSAPEDVEPGETVPLPDDSEGLAEDDFLSTEELANLDDSFDFVTVSDQPLEGETPLEDEIAFLDTPEAVEAERATPAPDGGFDEVSLDDFVSFEDVPLDDAPAFVTESLADAANAASEEDSNEEFLDIDIDIEDDIGDEELEIIEGATQRAPEPEAVSTDSFAAQEVDLSEFGDFEEVTPVSDSPLAEAEDLPEVMDLPEMPTLEDEIELPDEGFFEETVLEDALPALVDEGPVSLDLEPDDQTDLDHIMALEEDLTSGIRTNDPAPEQPVATPPAAPAGTSDMAALILGKIEQELSSIKQEISALKQEVTHMRAAPAPEPAFEVPEAPLEPAPKPHGFFDEEDDETIALTGDELDNILSTAEISEGEEAGLSLDEDLLGMDEEGNLLDLPSTTALVPEVSDDLHVTDEEFLAGTALDLNEPDPLAEDEISLGIPDSIELEDGLPLELEEGQTEDLLSSGEIEEELEITPLPEGLLAGAAAPLEIPFDDDIDLELEAPLAPELGEEAPSPILEESLDPLPGLEDLPALADPEGWSPSGPSLDEELLPAIEAVEPPPVVPAAPAGSSLSSGMKSELKAVLQYMDKLLASLPDDKIQEFAESEHFEVYKRLFEELGLIE